MKLIKNFIMFVIIAGFVACGSDSGGNPSESLSSDKDITAFTILGINGTIGASDISLIVPAGTDLTALVPTITITGESVSPASGVAQDFTNSVTSPVVYTVTAEDATQKVYNVIVGPPAPPSIITGSHITVSGASDTYVSYNPMTEAALSCCSYNATPECGAADVPDIACYVTLVFNSDGTAAKIYDADPTPGVPMPGH